MASQDYALDVQADALRLVLHPPGKPPRFLQKELPAGAISDPEVLSAQIRQFLKENKIPPRRCILIPPRQQPLTDLTISTLPRELALGALLTEESACLVVPDGAHFQAALFHNGTLKMGRALEDSQALTQILHIYHFSNPDIPAPTVYLPASFPGVPAGDWEIRPLEGLLPEGIPAEAAAAFGGLRAAKSGAVPGKRDFHPKKWVIALGSALAVLLFLYTGIYRPLAARNTALAELAQQQILADQLEARLEASNGLQEAYLRTGGGILTEAELSMADRIEILDLVEEIIFPRATVTEFTLSGNSLTLHLTGIPLQDAGALVSQLNQNPLIAQAQLHSAEADSGQSSNIFLRITLSDSNKEGQP